MCGRYTFASRPVKVAEALGLDAATLFDKVSPFRCRFKPTRMIGLPVYFLPKTGRLTLSKGCQLTVDAKDVKQLREQNERADRRVTGTSALGGVQPNLPVEPVQDVGVSEAWKAEDKRARNAASSTLRSLRLREACQELGEEGKRSLVLGPHQSVEDSAGLFPQNLGGVGLDRHGQQVRCRGAQCRRQPGHEVNPRRGSAPFQAPDIGRTHDGLLGQLRLGHASGKTDLSQAAPEPQYDLFVFNPLLRPWHCHPLWLIIAWPGVAGKKSIVTVAEYNSSGRLQRWRNAEPHRGCGRKHDEISAADPSNAVLAMHCPEDAV